MDQHRHDELHQRLNRVFQDVFDDETILITDATAAKDIDEWDSLMHITLVVAIEKEFRVRLSAAEVGKLENVGGMLRLLAERAPGGPTRNAMHPLPVQR